MPTIFYGGRGVCYSRLQSHATVAHRSHRLDDGSFPPMVGFTILTNGLIWWVPFGIILVAALRQMGTRNYQRVEVLPLNKALCSYRFANGDSISETSRKQTVLLCFLRHFG